ncbi:phasin family protein [Bifidobacterium sp. ESL0798]|uniref:phasin family protein n=1 Tax=unclassified Bifidobacterium TaxID=2608897 RepID=UPI0023F7D455|nr:MULTISPECIES: phasin family protein [unclassified Bifidobacterium]WEV53178.1 phasin family protein [Bifidobacterium sp. ESL0704]WEV73831.1 phasin family protein [Bifidobacterium sp. ESL0798]
MADYKLGDGLRTIVLAGIGAMATTAEKGQEIVDALVKKGELTVEQGKALNTELKHKAQEVKDDMKAENAEDKGSTSAADKSAESDEKAE